MGLPGLFRTSLLISVTLGPRSPSWESVINEGFVNISTVGCRGAASFDFQRVTREALGALVSEQRCLAFTAIFFHLLCISMDRE